MPNIDTLKRIENFFHLANEKIYNNEEKVICRKGKKETISGFCTILQTLLDNTHEVAKNSKASFEIQAQVQSWIDYASLYIYAGKEDKHICKQLLQELNSYLEDKSYFVGQSLTVADIAVFYTIYDLMKRQTPLEKENLLNLSRWFDHLQQIDDIRQNLEQINFTTIYLHGWATGTR
ncbi:EEF1E1 family protein [Megaselia abdita]